MTQPPPPPPPEGQYPPPSYPPAAAYPPQGGYPVYAVPVSYAVNPPGPVPLDKPYYGAGFLEASRRFFIKSFVFSGRASRSEFWWPVLLQVLGFVGIIALTALVITVTDGWDDTDPPVAFYVGSIALVAWCLVTILPGIAVSIRRLHDVNMSGWFYLLSLVPAGGIVLLVFFLLDPKPEGARFDKGAVAGYPAYVPPGAYGAPGWPVSPPQASPHAPAPAYPENPGGPPQYPGPSA